MKKGLLGLIVSLFLVAFLVGQAYGWNIEYVIEPNHEATETIPLTSSSSVIGNVSATGSINFYVSSPSGNVVYCSNETTFTPFSFTASEDGNYTLHMLNVNQMENVTASLGYSKNLVVVLTETIKTTFTQTATVTSMIPPNTTVTSPNPFDLTGVPSFFVNISIIIGYVYRKLKGWLRRRKTYEPMDYSIHYGSLSQEV
jgi:cytoskeletal protein RodZ